ncbi:RHS repeat-associated core domain-containing protein [Variovorax sp. GB1R11]|uniref:RHS repeat-associated core domain-containing protein n=1 Tax=Variovorax sp. GB1R11 TaxID=3443741 RepID=UPI003F46A194
MHYNRYRYYDPYSGRFISKDPIGLNGGINVLSFAPNPVEFIDPLGLQGNRANRRAGKILADNDAATGGHAYSRHGAHTTMPQQERRATTGVPPDNPCKVPQNHRPDSTRFLSNIDQLDAIQKGREIMNASGLNYATFDMGRAVGEGYRSGGGCPVTTSRVTVRRNNTGEYTAYPQL